MSPRKKIHANATARMKAARDRFKAEGKRQIAVWLPGEIVEKLDRLAAAKDTDRADVLTGLIKRESEPKN